MQPAPDKGGNAIQFEPFIPPSTAELDEMIPGYTFLEFIERGGMGAVYKAVQKSLNRMVAVKLLPLVHRNKETFAERFKREAHALALLNHPHIIAVHDFGETADGQMYYVMEFVSGMDLQQLLKRDRLEPRQILNIITQVCGALQFAHEQGIVHRDIKPSNILVDERGNVKVADFGLAKIVGPQSTDFTASGATLGTPDYIAPEALDHSKNIDHRADIYSLGVMIYELFTGHVPKGMWEPPSVCSGADKGIDAVVSKAMQNNPEKRYQHVRDLTQVLEKLFKNSDHWKNFRRSPKSELVKAAHERLATPTNADTIQIKPPRRRKFWLVWAAGVLLLFACAAVVAWQAGWLATPVATVAVTVASSASMPSVEQVRLAEWVLAHDGFVNVTTATHTKKQMGGNADICYAADLPPEPFTISRVSFSFNPIKKETDFQELITLAEAAGTVSNLCLFGLDVPVSQLALLSGLHSLHSLDLSASPVVKDDAVEYLAACKSMHLLRLTGPAGGSMAQKLGALLPECKVITSE